jgi:hypothetical protein
MAPSGSFESKLSLHKRNQMRQHTHALSGTTFQAGSRADQILDWNVGLGGPSSSTLPLTTLPYDKRSYSGIQREMGVMSHRAKPCHMGKLHGHVSD